MFNDDNEANRELCSIDFQDRAHGPRIAQTLRTDAKI